MRIYCVFQKIIFEILLKWIEQYAIIKFRKGMVIMKKLLSMLLSMTMLFSISVYASNTDISEWAREEVDEAIELGFVIEDLQCDYQDNITREEFAATAVEYLAYQRNLSVEDMVDWYVKDNNFDIKEVVMDSFNDISDSQYKIYILYANTLGIVNGYGDGTFKPNNPITREEAAVMLSNVFARYTSGFKMGQSAGMSHFTDFDEISKWAISSVRVVNYLDVMIGVSDDKFSPKTHYTREQCFATFLRLCQNSNVTRYNNYDGSGVFYVSYEDLITDIEQQQYWVCHKKIENDNYMILYGGQQAGIMGNTQFWIVYKYGGRKRIDNQFNFDYGRLSDFEFDESGRFLYCVQTEYENGYKYKIDLVKAQVEII